MIVRIGILGGGNMGFALANGLLRNPPWDIELTVSDPDETQLDKFRDIDIRTTKLNKTAINSSDVVILAVKPQIIEDVIHSLSSELQSKLVVSIAAGVPLQQLNRWLNDTTAIVRCMPNTPALIGAGITGMIANVHVSQKQRDLVEQVLACTGKTLWFKEDRNLDAVTAISGSGPAYFFYLMEAIERAGLDLGIDKEVACALVHETALGAAKMAAESSLDAAALRAQVTSPGGTTESAIKIFDKANVQQSIIDAVKGAYHRSIELGARF